MNWLGGYSRWVAIGSQSGRIATIENSYFDLAGFFDQYTSSPYNLSPNSEELHNQQIVSAREFTRDGTVGREIIEGVRELN